MLLETFLQVVSGDVPLTTALLYTLYSVVSVLLIFPVHECAHGLGALIMGDKTAKYQGRLTLNPLAHIDLFGFLMLLILGFGWAKPVQFDPRNFKNRRWGTIVTAMAGPLSNIIFAFICFFLWALLSTVAYYSGTEWLGYFSTLFSFMATYNASFAVFNLIPVPPLDGSKILGELLPIKLRFRYYNLERYSYIIFLALILVLNRTGILGILSNALLNMFVPLVDLLLGGIF